MAGNVSVPAGIRTAVTPVWARTQIPEIVEIAATSVRRAPDVRLGNA